MPIPKISTVLISLLVIIIAGGSAYVLGLKASEIIQNREYRKAQAEQTLSILKKMNGVGVGYKLPDIELSDLEGKSTKLSQIINSKMMISFMQPNCGYCGNQINALNETVPADKQDKFIIISDGWRDDLLLMREEHNIQCRIFHDADSRLIDSMGVWTWPFNLIVSKDLEILEILAGLPSAEYIRSMYGKLVK